jgi:hypothetical protein
VGLEKILPVNKIVGIAESFGCQLELPATIARGDSTCQIRFVRK